MHRPAVADKVSAMGLQSSNLCSLWCAQQSRTTEVVQGILLTRHLLRNEAMPNAETLLMLCSTSQSQTGRHAVLPTY